MWDSKFGKSCIPCDISCGTCRQKAVENETGCTTCAPGYNYQWPEKATCYKDSCPEGTYGELPSRERCKACVIKNCMICKSAANCERCDPDSDTPILENNDCLSVQQCLDRKKTPIYINAYP